MIEKMKNLEFILKINEKNYNFMFDIDPLYKPLEKTIKEINELFDYRLIPKSILEKPDFKEYLKTRIKPKTSINTSFLSEIFEPLPEFDIILKDYVNKYFKDAKMELKEIDKLEKDYKANLILSLYTSILQEIGVSIFSEILDETKLFNELNKKYEEYRKHDRKMAVPEEITKAKFVDIWENNLKPKYLSEEIHKISKEELKASIKMYDLFLKNINKLDEETKEHLKYILDNENILEGFKEYIEIFTSKKEMSSYILDEMKIEKDPYKILGKALFKKTMYEIINGEFNYNKHNEEVLDFVMFYILNKISNSVQNTTEKNKERKFNRLKERFEERLYKLFPNSKYKE